MLKRVTGRPYLANARAALVVRMKGNGKGKGNEKAAGAAGNRGGVGNG